MAGCLGGIPPHLTRIAYGAPPSVRYPPPGAPASQCKSSLVAVPSWRMSGSQALFFW